MRHQFVIGVSGYTLFPRIGDPTPVRLLPPPVDPKRFVRRRKHKAFASWDEKVRLKLAAAVAERFRNEYETFASGYVPVKTWANTYTPPPAPPDAYTKMERITQSLDQLQKDHHIDDEIVIRCRSRRGARNLLQALMRSPTMQCMRRWQDFFYNFRTVPAIWLNNVKIVLDVDKEELDLDPARHHVAAVALRKWPPDILKSRWRFAAPSEMIGSKVAPDDGIVGKLRRGEEL